MLKSNNLEYKWNSESVSAQYKINGGEFSLHCRHDQLLREVTIALVGKYTQLEDAYASVIKALQHSALCVSHRLNLRVGMGVIMLSLPFVSVINSIWGYVWWL